MKGRSGYARFAATVSRTRRTSTVGLFLALFATSSAFALGTPEQRKACTPDVYRLCAGEIPNARHHGLPATAKGEFERGLQGDVRAVTASAGSCRRRGRFMSQP